MNNQRINNYRYLLIFIGVVILLVNITTLVNAQSSGGVIDSSITKPAPINIPHKLTLSQAEDLLIQHNLVVATARYQIEAGRAAKLIASYKPNPVLEIGLEQVPLHSNIKGSVPRFFATDSNAAVQPTYTLRLDKVIERGGKRELRTEQADLLIKASEVQMLDAMRTQIFQLRQAFAAAILANENLRLAQATNQQYEQTEHLTAVKVEVGDLPGVELYRVRAGRLQYQQIVLQAHSAYEQATRDILNLLGARVEDVESFGSGTITQNNESDNVADSDQIKSISQKNLPINDDLLSATLNAAPLEVIGQFSNQPVLKTIGELRQLALSERPDVMAARYNLEAAERALRLAKAQRTRDITVSSEYQRVAQDDSVGVVVQVPIFAYNNQQAGITQAEAQRRAAETQLHQVEMQATTEVEKAYQAYRAAKRTLELYDSENLVQVEKLHNISTYSYQEGAVSLFELLDAQRIYNQALTAYNQARADYQISLWQLEAAIGRPLS